MLALRQSSSLEVWPDDKQFTMALDQGLHAQTATRVVRVHFWQTATCRPRSRDPPRAFKAACSTFTTAGSPFEDPLEIAVAFVNSTVPHARLDDIAMQNFNGSESAWGHQETKPRTWPLPSYGSFAPFPDGEIHQVNTLARGPISCHEQSQQESRSEWGLSGASYPNRSHAISCAARASPSI